MNDSLKPEVFVITKVGNTDVTLAPRSDTLRQHYSGNGWQADIEYKIKRIFREIVFHFSSNGCMQPELLSFLSSGNTVMAQRNIQHNSSILKQENRVSDKAVLTLIGIKILNEFFADSRKVWSLVEKKARKFVMQDSNLTKEDVDQALSSLISSYN